MSENVVELILVKVSNIQRSRVISFIVRIETPEALFDSLIATIIMHVMESI